MRIALSKGYLLGPAIELFQSVGIDVTKEDAKSRKLTFTDKSGKYEFVVIRPADVPVYVEHGAVDIGIAGKDVLVESSCSVAELLDMKFGYCKMVVAALQEDNITKCEPNMRVATKFVNTTVNYFKEKDLNVEIIKLYGSVELAPIAALSDVIVDLTATGTSLRENNLEIVDTIMESTARLVANKVKMKTNFDEIIELTEKLQKTVRESNN
ncbi:ATP phosphoribosyltransferase [Candidatus Margulisiibacteriota bacterium]